MCSTLGADTRGGAQVSLSALTLEDRLCAMEDALPPGAQAQSGMSDLDWLHAEEHRLAAFEAGRAQWWLVRAG